MAASRTGFFALTVAKVDRFCEDAAAVTFAVPPELQEIFSFRPGHFVTVRRTVDGLEHRRSYSICSPAGASPRIGVREVPGGIVSGWLIHQVRPGDQVDVQAPEGKFTPDLTRPGTHVLIAAGSGITPILSIAASVLADGTSRATLIYGNRRTDSVMFSDEVADLKDAYMTQAKVLVVLSREVQEVELFNGRMDARKLEALIPAVCTPAEVDHWWLCGPYGMTTDAVKVLGDLGVPDERIHRELFYVEDVPPDPVLHVEPQTAGATVTVVLEGRATTSTVGWDSPLLDGLQKFRSELPFACKGGVCGTCRAKVTEGEVRMRRNFALEPAEVEAGYVLTCQSLCLSDAVTVDFDD